MTQMDLLAGVPRRELARARGEELGERCADKARRVADFDAEGARRFVHGYLVRHGKTAGEQLVNAAIAHGFRPHDARAFGPVFSVLAKRGQIRSVGFCERLKGHGTAGGRVWEATPCTPT